MNVFHKIQKIEKKNVNDIFLQRSCSSFPVGSNDIISKFGTKNCHALVQQSFNFPSSCSVEEFSWSNPHMFELIDKEIDVWVENRKSQK